MMDRTTDALLETHPHNEDQRGCKNWTISNVWHTNAAFTPTVRNLSEYSYGVNVMARLLFAVAAFVLVAVGIAAVPGADESLASRKASATLAERLAGVKNVGLVYDEKVGGFQLIVLNEVLHQHLMVNLQTSQRLFAEREEQEMELRRLQLAVNKDFDAIERKARSLEWKVEYPFASGFEMFQITQTTSDYIELEAVDTLEGRPKTLVVIPWQRLALIAFPQYIQKHMPGQQLLQTLSIVNGEKTK